MSTQNIYINKIEEKIPSELGFLVMKTNDQKKCCDKKHVYLLLIAIKRQKALCSYQKF